MVYVDRMYAAYGRMIMCHMVADSQAELLEMADKIGVQRKWLQYKGTYREHIDVSMTKRSLAIENGAKQVSGREIVAIMNKKKDKEIEDRR